MKKSITDQLGGVSSLNKSLHLNLNWIKKSIDHNNGLGSSAYRTLWGTWSGVYPETTGYLIPTLLNASQFTKDEIWFDYAKKSVAFLKTIQNEDGSFYKSIENPKPIVFDTAQILFGFCAYHEKFSGQKEVIKNAYSWLLSQINDKGLFINYNYVLNYNPAYYSRIFWPMLCAEKLLQIPTHHKIEKGLENILQLQNENGSFNDWSFDKNKDALTHTIVYTLRGLWECADSLPHLKLEEACVKSVDVLLSLPAVFAGAYNQNLHGDFSFVCSVGNAQMAVLLNKIYTKKKNPKYLEPIVGLLKPLLKSQSHSIFNSGAIPASIPFYGKYQRFRYTNWTQKFFVDAILELIDSQSIDRA